MENNTEFAYLKLCFSVLDVISFRLHSFLFAESSNNKGPRPSCTYVEPNMRWKRFSPPPLCFYSSFPSIL